MTLPVSPVEIASAWEQAFGGASHVAPDAIASLFADNGRVVHPYHAEPIVGRAAIRQAHVGLFVGWEQSAMKVSRVTGGDHSVALDWHFSSVQTGTGAHVELDAVSFMQLGDDGKIVEERRFFDVFLHVNAEGKVEADLRQFADIDYRKMAAEIGQPVDGGESIEAVSAFLDHSSLAVTSVYLRRLEGQTDEGWGRVAEAIGV